MADMLKTILKPFLDRISYMQRGFLSSFFKTTDEDFTNTDEIEIDIQRAGHFVAPVMKSLKTGAVYLSEDDFSTKKFKPPVSSVAIAINIMNLLQRMAGEKSDASIASFRGRLFQKLSQAFFKLHPMFRELMELQAAQVLQTGKIILEDENSQEAYELEYPVKDSHMQTVAVSWGDSGADPAGDLQAIADVVTDDGLRDASIAVFGSNAWNAFVNDANVKEMIKLDGTNLGGLDPALKNKGGRYMGYIFLGSTRLELWVYNNSYQKIVGGTVIKYMDPDKVIVTASLDTLDFRMVFGGIPTLGMEAPFTGIIPSEVTYDGVARIYNRVWKDEKADTYVAEAKCRPLAIPVAIDCFACLTTKAP